MPLNFPPRRKWFIVGFLGAITFMTPFASSILAPAIEFLNRDFGNSDLTVGSFPVSIYLLGYSVGPLFLSPLSEIYGRHIVLVTANIIFCLWLIGCALAPSLDSLIVFRFFAGVGGSGCLTIGGGIISDIIPVEQRGLALTVWMIGPLLGPSLGPICGAFIAETIGWRWTNWIVLIPGAIATILLAVFSSETNHRVLIKRKVARLRKSLNRSDLRSVYDDPELAQLSKTKILLNGLIRPIKMLLFSPLIFFLSLYIAFAYGVLYLLFNTIPMVFQGTYGWSLGLTGLVYLALGLGYVVGMVVFTLLSDRTVVRMTMMNNGVYEPEMRLPDCIYFAFLLPVSFFWYGWTTHYHTHWIVPILGLVPFGIGIVGIWQPIQAYIIDAYLQFAASGLAAFTVFRSVVAAFLPLAGPQMYASLGLGWGNSLLGFIAMSLIPVPTLIYKFGGRLRKSQKLKL
jgi:multidrug resistance protein